MDNPGSEDAPRLGNPVVVFDRLSVERFREEFLPALQPLVVKGLVKSWPAVQAALQSDAQAAAYFKALDVGHLADISICSPDQNGRFFYTPDMKGFNFGVERQTISRLLDCLLALRDQPAPSTLYSQSLYLPEYMPHFRAAHPFDLAPEYASPRLWIGNRVRTQTHFDAAYNWACLVAGRRRFTLFSPEQIGNLYPGPIDFSPGGIPLSMVQIEEPDFEKYPRFRDAIPHAQYAELEPGDALFIPYGWWHHVQSLTPFNLLVNYWWSENKVPRPPAFSALLVAIASWRDLPEPEKALWRRLMDLYVFGDHQAMSAHLPEHRKGLSGPITPEVAMRLTAHLKNMLGVE